MPRSGFGGAVTWIPAAWRRSMTPFQLEASAKAPWTSTTVSGPWSVVAGGMRPPRRVDSMTALRTLWLAGKVVADAALDHPMRRGPENSLAGGAGSGWGWVVAASR